MVLFACPRIFAIGGSLPLLSLSVQSSLKSNTRKTVGSVRGVEEAGATGARVDYVLARGERARRAQNVGPLCWDDVPFLINIPEPTKTYSNSYAGFPLKKNNRASDRAAYPSFQPLKLTYNSYSKVSCTTDRSKANSTESSTQ